MMCGAIFLTFKWNHFWTCLSDLFSRFLQRLLFHDLLAECSLHNQRNQLNLDLNFKIFHFNFCLLLNSVDKFINFFSVAKLIENVFSISIRNFYNYKKIPFNFSDKLSTVLLKPALVFSISVLVFSNSRLVSVWNQIFLF